MGNAPLCMPICTIASTKIIYSDGTVTHSGRPVRASELMLDHPGQFVCDAGSLAVGCRVPGVSADEFLEPRHAYFLLPMDMLYSVLTDEEMAALSCHATTASSKRSLIGAGSKHGGKPRSDVVRIFPVLGVKLQAPDLAVALVEHGAGGAKASGGVRRQRSWQPALDTIEEVP